jgi:hypothetical protein
MLVTWSGGGDGGGNKKVIVVVVVVVVGTLNKIIASTRASTSNSTCAYDVVHHLYATQQRQLHHYSFASEHTGTVLVQYNGKWLVWWLWLLEHGKDR